MRYINARMEYTLPSGRCVFLVRLSMRETYSGELEGTAEEATERYRKEGYARIIQEDTLAPTGSPNLLPFSPPLTAKGVKVIDEGWAAFPKIQWMGVFESSSVHVRDSDWESRLSVYWFTPGLPRNFDTMVAEVVGKLDWEGLAEDFDASW